MSINTVQADPDRIRTDHTSLTDTGKKRYRLYDVLSVISRFKFDPDKGILTPRSERTIRSIRELDRKRRYRNLTKLIKTYPILALYDPDNIRVIDSIQNDINLNFYEISNEIPTEQQLTKRLIKSKNPGKEHYRTLAQLVVRQKMLLKQEQYIYYKVKRMLEEKGREVHNELIIYIRRLLQRLTTIKHINEKRLLKTKRRISRHINLMSAWISRQIMVADLSVEYIREFLRESTKSLALRYTISFANYRDKFLTQTRRTRRWIKQTNQRLGRTIELRIDRITRFLGTDDRRLRNIQRWALVMTSLLAAVINLPALPEFGSSDKASDEISKRSTKESISIPHQSSRPNSTKQPQTKVISSRSKQPIDQPKSRSKPQPEPTQSKPVKIQSNQSRSSTHGQHLSERSRTERRPTHHQPTHRSTRLTQKNSKRVKKKTKSGKKIVGKNTQSKSTSRKQTKTSRSTNNSRSQSTKQTKPDVNIIHSPKPKVSTTITTSANRAMFVMTHPKAKKHSLEDRIVKLAKSMVGKELGYKYKTDDCYDFITKVLFAAEHNISIDEVDQHGWTTYQSILDYGWTQRITFDRRNPNVKTGDILYVKHSPFRSRYNHWGIVYVKRRGKKKEIYVIHRGKKVFMSTLDWFIHNSKRSGQVIIFRRSTGNKQLA